MKVKQVMNEWWDGQTKKLFRQLNRILTSNVGQVGHLDKDMDNLRTLFFWKNYKLSKFVLRKQQGQASHLCC